MTRKRRRRDGTELWRSVAVVVVVVVVVWTTVVGRRGVVAVGAFGAG